MERDKEKKPRRPIMDRQERNETILALFAGAILLTLALTGCSMHYDDGGGQTFKMGGEANPCAPACPKPDEP